MQTCEIVDHQELKKNTTQKLKLVVKNLTKRLVL